MIETKERPVLFSGPMVRAMLNNEKTQTRRVLKPQPYLADNGEHWLWDGPTCASLWAVGEFPDLADCCPYGKPGDVLWVRESFFCNSLDYPEPTEHAREELYYRADGIPNFGGEESEIRCRPSIHMPRWASRLTLEVVSVRVERVQGISEIDAMSEGVAADQRDNNGNCYESYREGFRLLWDEINAKRGHSFTSNPYVWVLDFRRIDHA